MTYKEDQSTQDVELRAPLRVAHAEVTARLAAERQRIADIKAASARPFGAGPEIVDVAPARGTVERFTPRETVNRGGRTVVQRSGWRGHDALRVSDAFDVMEAQAARRFAAEEKKRALKDPASKARMFVPPFSKAQLIAGRDYAALSERVASAGVRCSSVEALGAGGQGSFIDAVIRDVRHLDAMLASIGDVVVLAPVRKGRARRVIRARALVDQVCIANRTLSDVLLAAGWTSQQGSRDALRTGLCQALDRMYRAI
ncbi:hypothetical protein LGQ03_07250 [Loktanella sp. TSTF-M6]|uniref:Uncharacterized protein n=1 Tax=Loktanella gaetbuli TaxID=2881335 RepID=A0ABS8BTH6_9RHOB|nr:hypothetical protein [Loktanella gaetbuli]MCB5199032.1 hypothetical protein [Loktanella gaetbuli]